MNNTIVYMLTKFCWNPNRIMKTIGANMIKFSNETNEVGFRFKYCKEYNICMLKYNDENGLYNLSLGKGGRVNYVFTKEFKDVPAEELRTIFEKNTGLKI